jgi:tetratricopeptide (TPR) repeat protein
MATGRRPFPEKQATQLIAAILSEPAQPPRELNGRVSPGLEAIILKALEKDPARRYQSAKELREDVERLSSTGRVAARRSALRRHWTLAEAHIDAADEEFAAHWNWAKAEEEFRHAVELNPGSSDAQLHYAICLWALRRYDEALPVMEHARQLDPLSPYVNALLAGLLRDSHQDERAIEQYRKMLDLDPKARSAWFGLAIVYADLGRNQESVAAFVKGAQLSGESPERIKALEQALKAEGPRSFWQVQLEQQKKEAPGAPGLALGYASIYARLGEKDHAMEWLERAYAERWPLLCWVNANRVWDPLRSAPRFQDLLRRMNFPP